VHWQHGEHGLLMPWGQHGEHGLSMPWGTEWAGVGAVGALVGAWATLSAGPRVVSGVLGDSLEM
jgi:hypothetical protein